MLSNVERSFRQWLPEVYIFLNEPPRSRADEVSKQHISLIKAELRGTNPGEISASKKLSKNEKLILGDF